MAEFERTSKQVMDIINAGTWRVIPDKMLVRLAGYLQALNLPIDQITHTPIANVKLNMFRKGLKFNGRHLIKNL